MKKDELGEFCYCSDCSMEYDRQECKCFRETDGFVKATDEKGCGLPA